MKFAYKDLLPSYLDGPNIRRHGELVDMSTEYLYDQLGVLGSWNNLTRPVLIKKEQEEKWNATYTVYVDLPYAIQSITISGDYTATVSFSEEDCVTSYTLSFPFSVDPDSTKMIEWYGFANATFEVCVETYEGYTYKKGYPENDSIMGDVYDHDRLLDLLGTVLTIPRRIYSQFQANEMGRIADTIPFLFGKRMEQITTEFGTHWYVLSCTEDDYYYSERLKEFIHNLMVEKWSIEKCKLKAVYEAEVTDEMNYNQTICHMDVDDMNTKNMAEANSEKANTYVYKIYMPTYINLPVPDTESLTEFISQYISLTKNMLVITSTDVRVELLSSLASYYDEGDTVTVQIRITSIDYHRISGIPVECGWINNKETGYTDDNGVYTYQHTLQYSPDATEFVIEVDDLEPYTGTTVSYPSTIRPSSVLLPVSVDATVTSATINGITVEALFSNSDTSTSINLDGTIKLYDMTSGTATLWDTVSLSNQSSATLHSPNGTLAPATYNLQVELVAENPPEGYYYDNPITDTVTATVQPVLLPVTLDTIVTSATTDGISVDVDFQNTTTSTSLSLDGTITLSINDGTTTTLLDTETLTNASTVTLSSPSGTTFTDGTYTLLIELNAINPPAGYYYDNPITASETITITSGTSIDCTTTDSWLSNNLFHSTTATLNNNGYITNTTSNGTEYLTALNTLVLQKNMTIHANINKTSGNYGFGIIQLITGGYNQFYITNTTLTEKHNGTSNTTNVSSLANTSTISISIDNNGYITINDGNNTCTSSTAYTDAELAMMTLAWQHGTDKAFSLTSLTYNCDNINNTHIYDWCTSTTNWTSTNSSYLPEVTTQQGLIGVKAPQGNRNMSYNMSYFTEALRLDEDIVIRCEVDIGGLQNLLELGIITKDNINSPYQYRTWAVLFLTNSDRKIDNLNGTAVACGTPYTNKWYPMYFRIKNRQITVIFGDNNDSVGSYTTTVNTVSSDDTKNNRCYLGMHSAEGSYPLAGMRCVSITKFQ